MTKVGQLFEREKISYGNEQRRDEKERTAAVMLRHGDDEAYAIEVTELTQADIDRILGRTVETVTA